ncbi:MAG TPA: MAPEG family protein [Terriglobales bacterium]|nr:MAPEG family protein [Terriglobales bacterium]
MSALSPELTYLVWSVALCVVQMLIAVNVALPQLGFPAVVGNRDKIPALEGLAGRALRAHYNMLENLPLFIALVLVAQVAGRTNSTTALGAELFFYARLIHTVIYLVGIPYLRTLAWALSMVGLVMIFLQLI